jgi:hypothetical protein
MSITRVNLRADEVREAYYQALSTRMAEFREDWEGIEVSLVVGRDAVETSPQLAG